MLSASSIVLAAAAVASAQNVRPPVPLNAQIGKLHFPVTCEIYGFLSQTFDTVFTATAPIFGGTGQEIYYTDVTGLITIPSYITSLAPLVSASQASANVTVALDLTNASPSNPIAFQGELTNIAFSAGEDGHIHIPVGGGTLGPIGPITLGEPDIPHRIFLGNVEVSIELQNSTGDNVFGPIPVTCSNQNIDYVIGSIDVNSTADLPPFSPSVGYVPPFPDTPEETESGSFRFPYQCDIGPLGTKDLDLTITGEIATYFAPGATFYLTDAQSFLTIPAALIHLARTGFPTAVDFVTTISNFEILAGNANPSTINAVGSSGIVSTVSIPADNGEDFVLPIPVNGDLPDVGPFTAGAAGNLVSIGVGVANATTNLVDSNGKVLYSLDINCNVPAPLELIAVPITSELPGNYSLGTNNTASSS